MLKNMNKFKRIIVTGGSGFVGANLVHKLVSKGYEVHLLVNKNSDLWRLRNIEQQISVHHDVLRNKSKLSKLIKTILPYAVFHLATYGSYPSQKNISQILKTNIIFTNNLLEVLINIPYKQFVIAGSSSEYGKKDRAMRETDMLDPNNFYAAAKAAQTHLAITYSRIYNKPACVLRLFNIYGYYEEQGRLVRSVIESALANKPILLSTGKEARDFVFAEDVADAFIHTLNLPSIYGEVFNIGSGVQTSIKELAEKIKQIVVSKSEIKLNSYPGRVWDSMHWRADVSKAKKIFGWQAKISLTQGLKKTIVWYIRNK